MKEATILKRLKGFRGVTSMIIDGGNTIPKQFIITFDNGTVFKSYNSIIAVKYKEKVYLGKHWNYSNTTGKYRNQFLNEGVADTREKIKSNEYKMLIY